MVAFGGISTRWMRAPRGARMSGVGRGERGLQVVAGQRDGSVRLLDAMGTQIGEHGMGAAIMRLGCFDLLGDGREQIVAVDADGNLVVLADE